MALRSNESEHAMATDYDAPRKQEEESPADSLEALQASRGGNAQTAVIDVDENDTAEGIDLPDGKSHAPTLARRRAQRGARIGPRIFSE